MTDGSMLPAEYEHTFRVIREQVTATRHRVQLAANAQLVHLYWSIGKVLLERSKSGQWGSGVLNRLADDLRSEFPSMKGLSATNLKYMRQFAAAWPEETSIGQQAVDRLPWGHITQLLGVPGEESRAWYARSAVQGSWSRNVLRHNIKRRVAERHAAAPTNFSRLLDSNGDDLAQQVTRDPYILDFLAVDGDRDERALESAMVDRIATRFGSSARASHSSGDRCTSTSMAATSSSISSSSTSSSSGTSSWNSRPGSSGWTTSGSSRSTSPSSRTGCVVTRTRRGRCLVVRVPACGDPAGAAFGGATPAGAAADAGRSAGGGGVRRPVWWAGARQWTGPPGVRSLGSGAHRASRMWDAT